MAGHDLQLLDRAPEEFRGAARAIGVAQPVKPEAPHPPALVPRIRKRVEVSMRRQGGMEGRVEDRDLRHARQHARDVVDHRERRAVVQGREGGQLRDLSPNGRVDHNAGGEPRAAMNHPMPNGGDTTHVDITHHVAERRWVTGYGVGIPTHLSLGQLLLARGVEQPQFEAARPSIEDQDVAIHVHQDHSRISGGSTPSSSM